MNSATAFSIGFSMGAVSMYIILLTIVEGRRVREAELREEERRKNGGGK